MPALGHYVKCISCHRLGSCVRMSTVNLRKSWEFAWVSEKGQRTRIQNHNRPQTLLKEGTNLNTTLIISVLNFLLGCQRQQCLLDCSGIRQVLPLPHTYLYLGLLLFSVQRARIWSSMSASSSRLHPSTKQQIRGLISFASFRQEPAAGPKPFAFQHVYRGQGGVTQYFSKVCIPATP